MNDRGSQLSAWQGVFDGLYDRVPANAGADAFDGWISSYDLQPMPHNEMLEWRATIASLTLADQPARVLDVACGSGMLTDAIVGSGADYWGTDISPVGLAALREALAVSHPDAAITLRCQAAHDTSGLPDRYFDAIVLNSVVQYFPDATYLAEVLHGLAPLLAPAGRIILGDVRDLASFECFVTAAWLAKTDVGTDAIGLPDRIAGTIRRNPELLLAPAFFDAIAATNPTFTGAEVRLKRGWSHNELTRYRYEVVLHTANTAPASDTVSEVAWVDYASVAAISSMVGATRPAALRVTGIPNSRRFGEAEVLDLVRRGEYGSAAARLAGAPVGVEPEALYAAGDALGYHVAVRPSDDSLALMEANFVAPPHRFLPNDAIARQPLAATLSNTPAPYPVPTLAR